MTSVSTYVNAMRRASKTKDHEVLLGCLEYYGLFDASELTLIQAEDYWLNFVAR